MHDSTLYLPGKYLFRFIHIDDHRMSLKCDSVIRLSTPEQLTLDSIIREHGGKDTWRLRDETHELPEYVQTYRPGTSTRIPYGLIAKVSGNEARFRKGRMVISVEATEHMDCPFPSGAEL